MLNSALTLMSVILMALMARTIYRGLKAGRVSRVKVICELVLIYGTILVSFNHIGEGCVNGWLSCSFAASAVTAVAFAVALWIGYDEYKSFRKRAQATS